MPNPDERVWNALTCTCDTGYCILHNSEPPLPPEAAGILDTINGLLDEVDVAAGKETVQVIVRMPQSLHDEFKARADAEERSVSAAIRHACRVYLEAGTVSA